MSTTPRFGKNAMPSPDLRCCANCTHWHKKAYIHCQCSGPWGGDIVGDKNCTFEAKKSQFRQMVVPDRIAGTVVVRLSAGPG